MGKRGRPLKDNKRDDSYRFRLNTEERQMLIQLSEWTEQPIAAVIRAALHIYYETIESERNIQFDNLEEKMMNESMKLDISKIEFEEAYDNTPFEEYTLYFIAPRDLVKDKYPEAEHSTISLELTTRTTMISPTKNGMDYDWSDIKLDNDTIDRLIALYILYKNRKGGPKQ